MNIWYANKRTSVYPIPRVIWNIIWFPLITVFLLLFVFSVLMTRGLYKAKEVWEANK